MCTALDSYKVDFLIMGSDICLLFSDDSQAKGMGGGNPLPLHIDLVSFHLGDI